MPRSGGRPIFQDIRKLSFDYVPERMPHRETQLEALRRIYQPLLDASVSQHAFLVGSVGTGKTHASQRFAQDLARRAREQGKALEHVLVNCRQRMSDDAVLLAVLRHWDPRFPERGFSVSEKLDALRRNLERTQTHFLVVLDEADVLVRKSSDLLYALTRFDEERGAPRGSVSVLLISTNKQTLTYLDPPTLSTFKRSNVVEFGKYRQPELADILRDRVDLAFFPEAVPGECVALIADIAAEYGDARYAIELLQKAGELALDDGSTAVSPEHVRQARAVTHALLTEDMLEGLDPPKMLALLAIARRLTDKAYLTTGEAEEAYALVCEEYDAPKRGHTQFWKYLQDLDVLGFIDAKASGEGVTGKTTVISMPEVPAERLIERLEAVLAA